MKITVFMVLMYIGSCIRIGTKPCKYFQLNSIYFDAKEGIYSKIQIDALIPKQWRLNQFYDDGNTEPGRYPVFAKPEWGQNAKGVVRIDSAEDLARLREETRDSNARYLIQECAQGKREFEIFSIQHHLDDHAFAVFSVTESINSQDEMPVNSIYNPGTSYHDITGQFSAEQQQKMWGFVRQIGDFKISRMSVSADDIPSLLAGAFEVIEINLFAPMPIHFLDQRYRYIDIIRMATTYMMCLARVTRHRDKKRPQKPVFTKVMLYDRRSRVLNFLRQYI